MTRRDQRDDLLEPDVFDILAATWVFACNDENPLITYQGLRHRLQIDESLDIRALVRKRTDLFRLGAPEFRLREWKADMRQDKRIPIWIRELPTEAERQAAIEALSANDVFRSQFRTNQGAAKSDLDVLKWGLEHIDRLRKVHYEAREKSAKSWQMWLVFAVGVANIVATCTVLFLKEQRSIRAEIAPPEIVVRV